MRVLSPQPKTLWRTLRSYLFSVGLLFVAAGLYAGGSYFGLILPWTLISLLVIAVVANFWGSRSALLVLALSSLLDLYLGLDLRDATFYSASSSLHLRLIRLLLFALCGGVLIGVAYEARRMRERAAQRRIVVQTLQRMVLPETLPPVPRCDFAAVYRPARQEEEVGGDFYDVFPVDSLRGIYGVLMGDVVGKGKEAAEHTALLRYAARAYFALPSGPAETLHRLSAFVESQQFTLGSASLFVGLLDAETGSLQYANAGHEPPLLARADGTEETLGATGPLIGLMSGALYEENVLALQPGDVLLLVTDGVTEARNQQGQFLDEDGTWRLLRASLSASSASAMAQGFHQRLDVFMAGRQRDDIAILLLRRLAPRSAHRLKSLLSSVKLPVVKVR